MSEFVLTPAERAFVAALEALGVRYLLVGMGAALLEGAHGTTQDLDLWFGTLDGVKLSTAARRAGGFYTAGFGLQPPAIGGEGLERVDLVLTASGLEAFEEEFARYVGAKHAVAVSSCTAALHVALAALGLGPELEARILSANAERLLGL